MDTWWIDKPTLMGSRNPTNAELKELRGDGFVVLISFLDENEQESKYEINYVKELGYVRHSIPVKDFHPPTMDQLVQFIKLVDELPAGVKVIAHCEGGTGRTGTFAAAYWIVKGMSATDAISYVRKARNNAVEKPEQVEVLHEFDKWMIKQKHTN
jgi:atypical dual specificity phosphatase